MRKLLLALALILVAQPVLGRSVQSDFSALWEARHSRYEAEQTSLADRVREASQPPAPPHTSQQAEAHYANLLRALEADAYVRGRNQVITALVAHMRGKPSAELSEAWIQEAADRIQRDRDELNSRHASLKALAAAKSILPKDYFAQSFELAATAGMVRGRVEELLLVDQNLASFYSAKSAAAARRRQARAAFFGALAGSLQNYSRDTSWTATCTTSMLGTTTTCMGN